MAEPLIRLVYQAWDEFDHAVAGLSPEEMTTRQHGGGAIGWTAAHVANTVQALLVRPFADKASNRLIGRRDFGTGGSGDLNDWPATEQAIAEVRRTARTFLETDPALDSTVPYDGPVSHLRESGLSLRYALMAIAAHHFLHAGEVMALRSIGGKPATTYPDWGHRLV